MHPLTLTLFTLLPSTLALPRKLSTPQPSLTNITYWGSACPPDKSGLTTVLGPPSTNTTNTTSFPLSFTLSNFLPTLDGSFGSSLRMCDIVSTVTIGNDDDEETPGWKVVVNKRGTGVSGEAKVPGNATMFLRGTYAFVESSEKQSVGMLDVRGPLTGQFSQRLVAEDEGDGGVVGSCGAPAELSVEFQARAVKDWEEGMIGKRVVNETTTAWVLETDLEVVRC